MIIKPLEFRRNFRYQTIRVPWLSYGVVCVILSLVAVLIQYWRVTDGQTDRWKDRRTDTRHDDSIYRASTASRDKNEGRVVTPIFNNEPVLLPQLNNDKDRRENRWSAGLGVTAAVVIMQMYLWTVRPAQNWATIHEVDVRDSYDEPTTPDTTVVPIDRRRSVGRCHVQRSACTLFPSSTAARYPRKSVDDNIETARYR